MAFLWHRSCQWLRAGHLAYDAARLAAAESLSPKEATRLMSKTILTFAVAAVTLYGVTLGNAREPIGATIDFHARFKPDSVQLPGPTSDIQFALFDDTVATYPPHHDARTESVTWWPITNCVQSNQFKPVCSSAKTPSTARLAGLRDPCN